jgi:hypothetical protein
VLGDFCHCCRSVIKQDAKQGTVHKSDSWCFAKITFLCIEMKLISPSKTLSSTLKRLGNDQSALVVLYVLPVAIALHLSYWSLIQCPAYIPTLNTSYTLLLKQLFYHIKVRKEEYKRNMKAINNSYRPRIPGNEDSWVWTNEWNTANPQYV